MIDRPSSEQAPLATAEPGSLPAGRRVRSLPQAMALGLTIDGTAAQRSSGCA